jgi:hypothetical protein
MFLNENVQGAGLEHFQRATINPNAPHGRRAVQGGTLTLMALQLLTAYAKRAKLAHFRLHPTNRVVQAPKPASQEILNLQRLHPQQIVCAQHAQTVISPHQRIKRSANRTGHAQLGSVLLSNPRQATIEPAWIVSPALIFPPLKMRHRASR